MIYKRYLLESSVIESLGYDFDGRICEIKFRNTGHTYRYENVDPLDIVILLFTSRQGEFFNSVFKRKYPNYKNLSQVENPPISYKPLLQNKPETIYRNIEPKEKKEENKPEFLWHPGATLVPQKPKEPLPVLTKEGESPKPNKTQETETQNKFTSTKNWFSPIEKNRKGE